MLKFPQSFKAVWLVVFVFTLQPDLVVANPNVKVTQVVATDVWQDNWHKSLETLATVKAKEEVAITSVVAERVVAIYFDDGDFVTKDQVLVELDSAEIKANLAELKVALANSEQEYQRYLPLHQRGDVSKSVLDAQKRELEMAKAKLAAMQAKLDRLTIKAPFAGQVGAREVSLGALLQPGLVVTHLVAIDDLRLDFSLPSRFLANFKLGDKVKATTDAYPEKQFIAELVTILPQVDSRTRSVQLRAKIDNSDGILYPGILMKVSLEQPDKQVLLVPETAIVPLSEDHFVYQLLPAENNLYRVKRVQVQLGERQPGLVEITSGLQLGDKIISEGALRVRPGQLVKALDKLPQISPYRKDHHGHNH